LNLGPEAIPPRRDWNCQVEKEKFAPVFDTWRFDWLDIPAVIAAASEVYEFPMVDRDPIKQWAFGRVTILGDAAHPMYPNGSNGASQAILDASALADAVQNESDIETALRNYEMRRLWPTSAITLRNHQFGPEVVMQMVEDRAPNGFTNIENVISRAELEEVANSYKVLVGFDLN
jgi:2-polyprenyl-6-methoxyphenol hydroxylase-like FAD-dependent oxidoreductase